MLRRKRTTLIVKTKEGILVEKPWFLFKYRLVGGGVKYGESFEEAGKREMFEETGLKVRGLKYLFDFEEGLQKHEVFFAEIKNMGGIRGNWENKNLKLVNKNNFREFKLNRYTKKILEIYFGV